MLTISRIGRAIAALEAGEMPEPGDVMHLAASWRRWRSGLPWEQAIGVAGPLRLAQRNNALRQAAAVLGDEDLEPWALAGRLEQALRWFEANRWPSIQAGGEPESPLDGHLSDVFGCGQPPARRQLCEILRGEFS